MRRMAYHMEYIVKSSPSVLYKFFSKPERLEQWFADEVRKEGGKIVFVWNKAEESAEVLEKKANEFIRFRWEDSPEGEYFEFRISKDEVGGGIALVITDFAEEEEIEDQKLLWESQVNALLEKIGGQG